MPKWLRYLLIFLAVVALIAAAPVYVYTHPEKPRFAFLRGLTPERVAFGLDTDGTGYFAKVTVYRVPGNYREIVRNATNELMQEGDWTFFGHGERPTWNEFHSHDEGMEFADDVPSGFQIKHSGVQWTASGRPKLGRMTIFYTSPATKEDEFRLWVKGIMQQVRVEWF